MEVMKGYYFDIEEIVASAELLLTMKEIEFEVAERRDVYQRVDE